MKRIVLLLITVLISCCNDEKADAPQSKIYSEWINYYDFNDFETHYHISSIAIDSSSKIYFSAYIRRNNFTVDCTWIFSLNNNNIYAIDSLAMFNNFKYYSLFINQDFTKSIWYNNQLLISYDNEESWYVTSLSKKDHSSRYQIDKYKNLWVTSTLSSNNLKGIRKFDGTNWTTYFEGSTFYAVCFDNSGNLYASTLPDFDEPGIIMRYNYNTWDTVIICSGNAKWVPCMHFDNNNNLWTGVLSRWAVAPESGDGLYMVSNFLLENKSLSKVTNDTTPNSNITHYHIYNSQLPSNSVIDIAIDADNNKWIGMYAGGLAKLTNQGTWKIFNKENSPLLTDATVIAVDNNYIWIAEEFYGLSRLKE